MVLDDLGKPVGRTGSQIRIHRMLGSYPCFAVFSCGISGFLCH
jgi:hypothetical protein